MATCVHSVHAENCNDMKIPLYFYFLVGSVMYCSVSDINA